MPNQDEDIRYKSPLARYDHSADTLPNLNKRTTVRRCRTLVPPNDRSITHPEYTGTVVTISEMKENNISVAYVFS